MSSFERAFCCGAVWRSSSRTIARELRAQRLGRDILEIGSGSGSVAVQLLSSDPELAWTAIDIDPHMTQAAGTRLREFPNASAKTGDATALPFSNDSFDSVVSCLMLHHIIDWERAVAEVARVLRPGGTFVGYDLSARRWPVCSTGWTARRIDCSCLTTSGPNARATGSTSSCSPSSLDMSCASSRLRTRRKSDGTIEYSCEI